MPDTAEVRQHADPVVHRTYDSPFHGSRNLTTMCGKNILSAWAHTNDVRRWRSVTSPQPITECETCFPPPEPVIYRCVQHSTHITHRHSRRAGSTTPWDRTFDPGADSPICTSHATAEREGWEQDCAPDGTAYLFSTVEHTTDETQPPRHELVMDTTEESSTMPDTFTPGDIVVATNGRPIGSPEDHLYVVICGDGGGPTDPLFTTLSGMNGEGRGWTISNERTNIPTELRDYLHGEHGYNFRQASLRHATDDEQRRLPSNMERARRRIQAQMLGAEPVLLCSNGAHMGLHRHSSSHLGSSDLMYRAHDHESTYHPLPGLWTMDPSEVTDPSRTRDAEPDGEPIDIHPLTTEKVRHHRTFTLHSKVADRQGNNLVLGCQTFPISVIADAGGTIEFLPGSTARATMPATVEASGYIRVGDRTLGRADINEYTERIMADPVPEPEPEPEQNAVVLEHGYYGCATHEGEMIHITNDRNNIPMLARINLRGGDGPGGTVGQRNGFTHSSTSECVPVEGSTSDYIMNLTAVRNWSLVPITDAQRTALTAARDGWTSVRTFGHLDTQVMVPCTRSGETS